MLFVIEFLFERFLSQVSWRRAKEIKSVLFIAGGECGFHLEQENEVANNVISELKLTAAGSPLFPHHPGSQPAG